MYETYLPDLKINFKGIANCVWHTTYKQYCNNYFKEITNDVAQKKVMKNMLIKG